MPIIQRDGYTAIICERGRPRRLCVFCLKAGVRTTSVKLCDHALRPGATCDAAMCDAHATNVGPDRDLCPDHVPASAARQPA